MPLPFPGGALSAFCVLVLESAAAMIEMISYRPYILWEISNQYFTIVCTDTMEERVVVGWGCTSVEWNGFSEDRECKERDSEYKRFDDQHLERGVWVDGWSLKVEDQLDDSIALDVILYLWLERSRSIVSTNLNTFVLPPAPGLALEKPPAQPRNTINVKNA